MSDDTVVKHTYNEPPDVLALLDKELQSCVLPSIADPSKASTEDILRDMYRVLAGNGGPTRGLVYKSAATNVHVKLLRDAVTSQGIQQDVLAKAVQAQKTRCDEVQAAKEVSAKVAEAERTTTKRIGEAIKENKSVIAVIIVGAAIMIYNRINVSYANQDRMDNSQKIEQAITHLLDIKMEQLQMLPKVNDGTNSIRRIHGTSVSLNK